MKRRCVIVSAADISNYDKIKSFLRDDDFFVFCDAGLKHQKNLQVVPDLIIGDFDSNEKPNTKTETIQLPCEKDDTDTFFAVKETIKRGFKNFLFIGSLGNRFDHSLCNISCLLYLKDLNIPAELLDDYSQIKIIENETIFVDNDCSYFSLMNITGDVSGVTIKNAKYLLDNADIKASYMYGISNEVLPGKKAEVTIKNGKLLLIKIW